MVVLRVEVFYNDTLSPFSSIEIKKNNEDLFQCKDLFWLQNGQLDKEISFSPKSHLVDLSL